MCGFRKAFGNGGGYGLGKGLNRGEDLELRECV